MRRIVAGSLLTACLFFGAATGVSVAGSPFQYGPDCGQFFLRWFPHIHQHGPLYNYGPYYGYSPFEPYGYWNSYLQYTGPEFPYSTGGGNRYGWYHGQHAWGGHLGQHIGHRPVLGGKLLPGHKSTGCSSCGDAAASYVSQGNALERYNGVGRPDASSAYYAGSVQVTTTPSVVPVGYQSW